MSPVVSVQVLQEARPGMSPVASVQVLQEARPGMSPVASVQVLQEARPGLNVRLSQTSGSEICISTKKSVLAIADS